MILSRISIAKLLSIHNVLDERSQAAVLALQKPCEVYGKPTPDDLNGISLGQLFALNAAVESESIAHIVTECARVLLDIPAHKVLRYRADRAMGFTLWVMNELMRIGKMWKAISPTPSAAAVQAGIGDLKFGDFGIADWYARRMGYRDHDDVLRLGWVRVWQCMKNDNEEAAFRERMQAVVAKQSKK